jgi:hypothetical protein
MPLMTMSRDRLARESLRAAELLAEMEADDRLARRRLARYFAAWLACYLAGTMVAFSSMATRSEETAGILLWGGLVVGNVGGFFVWIAWLVSGTNRGEL